MTKSPIIRRTPWLLAAALVTTFTPAGCQAVPPPDPLYGAQIVIPADASAELKGNASELARWLGEVTGRSFVIGTNATDKAIFLCGTNSPVLPARGLGELPKKSREAFLIRAEGDRLWIVGNSDRAVGYGVYVYLDQLGCRWFLPNDHWTIIPHRPSIALAIDRVEAPAFRTRGFFGTGGFGGKLAVDPNMELQARWDAWKKRNGMGGDIQISGHAGEAFSLAHKAELQAHPEYLAEINGQRQPWTLGVKPCYSNPDVRQLYIQDRLAAFKRNYDRNPDSPAAMAVSVEPSDGGGHCQCAECRKLGSVSDRVFTLANAVAQAVAVKYPGRYVSLLAYNEHAAVPHIAIEPNVFVLVVPYGFQRTGLPGDELLQAWGNKHRPLGVYDYWAITDWANCLPDLSVTRTVPEKIRFWHQQGVEIYVGESSYSAGAVGLVWYVASRLMWNPATDVPALLNDFYEKSFGPAALPMRRMLERWSQGFLLSDHELALAFRDLQEARALAKDPAVQARVDDYALYLEYIRLWHEYRSGGNHPEAVRALLGYTWRIYDSAMVHSFRMHQLICNRYDREDKALTAEWPLADKTNAVWTARQPVARAEIDQWIADGVQRYQPLEFEARTYTKSLVPLNPGAAPGTNWVASPTLVGQQQFAFYVGPGTTNVDLQVMVAPRPGGAPGDRVTVTDPQGARLLEELVPTNGQWRVLSVPTRAPGVYRLTVFDQKVTFLVKVPAALPFVMTGGYGCPNLSTRVFFYVPKGLEKLAIYAPGAIPIKLFDGEGKPVAHESKHLFAVDVPAGQDGRVWSTSGYKSYSPLRLVNAPSAFSFAPQSLMVPAELVDKDH